jgi:hypothetical protein
LKAGNKKTDGETGGKKGKKEAEVPKGGSKKFG